MKQEQALQIIVQVCEKGNKAGLFSLSESSLVLKALEQFGVKPPDVENVEEAKEVKEESEEKQVKD